MKVYTVRPGDSLFKIARRFYGNGYKYTQLAAYNGLQNPNTLEIGQVLRIPEVSELEKLLQVWHNYENGKIWWRVTSMGVEIKDRGVVKDARYTQQVAEIWKNYQASVLAASRKYGVPIPAIIATISTESNGNPKAYRYEPLFYRRYIKNKDHWKNNPYYYSPRRVSASYGLVQIMYTTAYSVGFRGEPEDLYDPRLNIDVGTAYIASRFQVKNHGWDPPKIACAYNAGSVRVTNSNAWGMYHHPGHLDRWIPSYNAAIEVIGTSETPAPPPKPPDSPQATKVVTLRFIFPQYSGNRWTPLIVDVFKHTEHGLGDPVSFKIKTAAVLPEGGYSYDFRNFTRGIYDFVFTDAASSSVIDDLADIVVAQHPTIVDLRNGPGSSRTPATPSRTIEEKSTVRILFPKNPDQSWKPVIIDFFQHHVAGVDEPLSFTIDAMPHGSGGEYSYDIRDISQGIYDIELTDAETFVLTHEIADCSIKQPLVTIDLKSERGYPTGPETSMIPSPAPRGFLERLNACWKILWG